MAARFELRKSPDEKYVFDLLTAEGQVVLSSMPHASRASALGGIEAVRLYAPDDGRFGRLSARDGAPYFTLKAASGQVLGQSQRFKGAKARDAAIACVQTHAQTAAIDDRTAL